MPCCMAARMSVEFPDTAAVQVQPALAKSLPKTTTARQLNPAALCAIHMSDGLQQH